LTDIISEEYIILIFTIKKVTGEEIKIVFINKFMLKLNFSLEANVVI